MKLPAATTLYIGANEIQTIRTGSQYLRMPTVDKTSTDVCLKQVSIEGYEMTCLVTYNMEGDAEIFVDLKTGIMYELMPVNTKREESVNPSEDVTSALPVGVR